MRKMILQFSTNYSCFGTNWIRSARFSFWEKYYNTRCGHCLSDQAVTNRIPPRYTTRVAGISGQAVTNDILQSAKRNVLQRASGTQAVGKQYPSLIQAFIAMSYCTGSKGHKRYKRRPSPMQAFISMSYCAGSKGHRRYKRRPSSMQAFISMSYCAGSKGHRRYKRRPSPMQAFIKATVRVQREHWMIRDSYYTSFAREG